MSNKEVYRQICETEGDKIPLFQQYWWMEAVCRGKQWDVALSIRQEGVLQGVMPYLKGSKFGLRYILPPQLTPYGGPWFNFTPTSGDRAEFEHRVSRELAAQIAYFRPHIQVLNFNPSVTDWLPFHWLGYRQTTRYTYRLDPIPTPEQLWQMADRGRKRQLEAARKAYVIDKQVGVDEFVRLHAEYWERRSGSDMLPRQFLMHLLNAVMARGQGLIYGLRTSDGVLVAARFVAFDSRYAYALLSAMKPNALRNCMTLLVWTLLEDLPRYTRGFDFEGSMHEGIEHFNRSFGAKQVPYFEITRFSNAAMRMIYQFKRK